MAKTLQKAGLKIILLAIVALMQIQARFASRRQLFKTAGR
jgi:hypothetical protein